MDHNYNEAPFLTSSDYEHIMEDLKPDTFPSLGSPFPIEQSVTYEDSMVNPVLRPLVLNTQVISTPLQPLPPPPPLENYEPVPVQAHRDSAPIATPPKQSPSLSPTGNIPSRDEYPGQLEFGILLDSATSSKKSWLYSHILNKVFIDMNKSLLIQFHVKDFINGLFVRALPVYEQDDFVSIPVQRCGLHAISDDPHGQAHPTLEPGICNCPKYSLVRHVVHCSHPQARFDYNSESDRHSVVVPLQAPHPGSDTTTVEYHFTCKTSCPHGMNRKPIVVIFTLETEQCEVLGRLVLPVKICSCPKRDKEKEEMEREERAKKDQDGYTVPKHGKRRLSSHEKQETKRIKTENTRQIVDAAQVPSLDIIMKRFDALETQIAQNTEKLNQNTEKLNQNTEKLNQNTEKLNQMELRIEQKFKELEMRMEKILNTMLQIEKSGYVWLGP